MFAFIVIFFYANTGAFVNKRALKSEGRITFTLRALI